MITAIVSTKLLLSKILTWLLEWLCIKGWKQTKKRFLKSKYEMKTWAILVLEILLVYWKKKFPYQTSVWRKVIIQRRTLAFLPPSSSSRDGLSLNLTWLMAQPYIFFGGPYPTHIKIFIILIKLIFQNNIFNKICGIFLIFFGDMATFAVEVWSWKLCQIKDPLVFGAAIRG